MQKLKTCPICGGKFVANKSTTIYCSKVCYGADSSRKNARRTNINVGYRELVAQLDGDKNKRHEFRVTKIYKHFFEAVRLDRGWERSFTKADYITGEVGRKAGE